MNFIEIKENCLILFKNPILKNENVCEVTLHNGKRVLLTIQLIDMLVPHLDKDLFYLLMFEEKRNSKYWLPAMYETKRSEIDDNFLKIIFDDFPNFLILE